MCLINWAEECDLRDKKIAKLELALASIAKLPHDCGGGCGEGCCGCISKAIQIAEESTTLLESPRETLATKEAKRQARLKSHRKSLRVNRRGQLVRCECGKMFPKCGYIRQCPKCRKEAT